MTKKAEKTAAVKPVYTHWSQSGLDHLAAPYESCAPNLLSLKAFLVNTFGGSYLGCHGNRDIRSGGALSSHAYGAAMDWRYGKEIADRRKPADIGRELCQVVCDFLIAISTEAGIQQIHDYWGDKIWRNDRDPKAYPDGWKKQNGAGSGMGEDWANYLHVEVNAKAFGVKFDYAAAWDNYLGEQNMSVTLGQLEILDEPYRLFDSRDKEGAPYAAGLHAFPHLKKPDLNGLFISVTIIAQSPAGYAGRNKDTSFLNWSKNGELNTGSIPVKMFDGKFYLYLSGSAHVIIDVLAEG